VPRPRKGEQQLAGRSLLLFLCVTQSYMMSSRSSKRLALFVGVRLCMQQVPVAVPVAALPVRLLIFLLCCLLPLLAFTQQTGECLLGDNCPNAHSVFESWLHPLK
jgi:hypothetical protein